ncbi:hypothetical protein Tco_0917987 [Tanacetum coccineum]
MATCHLLSGATWPASRHRSHYRTSGQRRRSTVATDGQRWRTTGQPPLDHQSTTTGPPVNHRRTTGQRWWPTGSWAGSGRVLGRVWIGSGSGRPLGVHVAVDVDYIPQLGVEPRTSSLATQGLPQEPAEQEHSCIICKMQVSGKKRENWTLYKALEQKDVINGYFYKRLIYKKLSAYDLELL